MMLERQGKKSLSSELRHYITIQTASGPLDGEGGETVSWVDTKDCFAAVLPIQAKQQFNLKSIDVDATHFVKVRGYIDIQEKQRVKFGSRFLEVLTVENIQELDVMKFCVCKEMR